MNTTRQKRGIVLKGWVSSICLFSLTLFATSSFSANEFFVSSSDLNKDDDGPGTEARPWATISKLNQQQFNAGDTVYFKRGDTWNLYEDESLIIQGYAGSEGAEITFSNYGNVNDPRPLLNGGKEFRSPASYEWIPSGGGVNEYYLQQAGGGATSLNISCNHCHITVAVKPSNQSYYPDVYDENEEYYLLYNPYVSAEEYGEVDRAPGTLEDDMWAFGMHVNDPITFRTIYIRCDDGNPNEIFSSIKLSQHTDSAINVIANDPATIEHITIRGLELRHIGNNALLVMENARHIEINDVVCKFNYVGIAALAYGSCDTENKQWGNEVHDCYLTQNSFNGIVSGSCGSFDRIYANESRYNHRIGIFSYSKSKTYIIEDNNCHHNSLEILNPQWAYWGIGVVQNSTNHYPIIRDNESHHNVRPPHKSCGDAGGINIRADNAKVYNNICYLNDGTGIGGDNMSEPEHYGAEIYNNVCYHNCQTITEEWCAEIRPNAGVHEFEIRNNILHRPDDSVPLIHLLNDDHSLGYNCYYSDSGGYKFKWGPFIEKDNLLEWEGLSGEIESFCANPEFENPTNADFHLKSNSLCIDAGDPDYDYTNEPEQNGCSINMGAYGNTPEATTSTEADVDEIYGSCDNCPDDYNPNQTDSDEDGVGDICDNCPDVHNSGQEDDDVDGIGDICDNDKDNDGLCDPGESDASCSGLDNCPETYNPNQEDTYPPGGNGIGDACDCEGNFDCDLDVDAEDVTAFLTDFGRNSYVNPCVSGNSCKGDFICDGDVDKGDVTKFLEDFGRGQYSNPCPACMVGDWCVY